MRATPASVIAGKCVFMAAIMTGVACVALPIPCLVAVEMVESLLASLRQRSMVTVVRIKTVVDVSIKAAVSVKPRAGSDEYPANKPVGPVVAVGSALVWGVIEVSVGAYRRHSHVDADCNLGLGSGHQA